MNNKVWVLIFVFLFGFGSSASAVDISVPPGIGTLAAAVAGASDGDTLILEDGGYDGTVIVDKSLTIRAVNRTTEAVVSDIMTIQGVGITVTLQGLTFNNTLVLEQATAIRILENHWIGLGVYINARQYKTSEGDGSLIVIGNRFSGGGIYDVYSENAYIAGNLLLNGRISSYVSVWIVGNEIRAPGAIEAPAGATVRVIGNRLICTHTTNLVCVDVRSTLSLIANNVVEVHDPDTYVSGSYSHTGIQAPSFATVVNNVVRGTPFDLLSTRSGRAISATSGGRVAGNIVLDYVSSDGTDPIIGIGGTEVTHNLCFNNSGDCPAGDGNLNVDPQLIDVVDYRLAATSPAIDAGPPDYEWADLDRSRNNMGVYGGPWSIGQYDAQRDPYYFGPYVYPLFKGGTAFSGGVLELQSIGVARLR